MEEKFGYKYLLTHRVNQDCLENFFSQVRYRNGSNDHPSPVDCLYRIKAIILGKNPGLSARMHCNTVEREPEEYASATFHMNLSDPNPQMYTEEYLDESYDSDSITEALDYNSDDGPEEFLDEGSQRISDYDTDHNNEYEPDEYYVTNDRIEFTDERIIDLQIDFVDDDDLVSSKTPFHVVGNDLIQDEEILFDQPENSFFQDDQKEFTKERLLDLQIEFTDGLLPNAITSDFLDDLAVDMPITTQVPTLHEDGLEYIAGWISYKLKRSNIEFCASRRESLPSHETDHTYAKKCITSASWIDCVSYGGLTKPSEQVHQWVQSLEAEFLNVHGGSFNYRNNVLSELIRTMNEKCKNVPHQIIELFARSRIYMRCKFLNKQILQEAMIRREKNKEARLLKQIRERDAEKKKILAQKGDMSEDIARSKSKKMKKITT